MVRLVLNPSLLVLLLFLGCVTAPVKASAPQPQAENAVQGEPRRPKQQRLSRRREDLFRQTSKEMLRAAPGLGAAQVRQFERMLRRVLDVASSSEFNRLSQADLKGRIRLVKKLDRAHRRARDAAFLATIEPQEVARIKSLPRVEQTRRITELRLERELQKAIRSAMAQGLLTEEAALNLRSASRSKQLEGARRLNKATFLHVHGDSLKPDRLARLKKLPARVFFEDPDVKRFRLLDGILEEDLAALRKLGRAERRRVFLALRTGGSREELQVFSEKSYTWIQAQSEMTRRRLARELERIRLPRVRRFSIPQRLSARLKATERRELLKLDSAGRIARLKVRFPGEDLDQAITRFEGQKRLDHFLDSLERGQRHSLGRMDGAALQKFFDTRIEDQKERGLLVEAAHRRGWGRPLRLPPQLARKLKPDEARQFRSMGPEKAIMWSLKRFRRELLPVVNRLLRQAQLRPLVDGKLPDRHQIRGLLKAYGGHRSLGRRLAEGLERPQRPRRERRPPQQRDAPRPRKR